MREFWIHHRSHQHSSMADDAEVHSARRYRGNQPPTSAPAHQSTTRPRICGAAASGGARARSRTPQVTRRRSRRCRGQMPTRAWGRVARGAVRAHARAMRTWRGFRTCRPARWRRPLPSRCASCGPRRPNRRGASGRPPRRALP